MARVPATALCLVAVPVIYAGPLDHGAFWNPGGPGPAVLWSTHGTGSLRNTLGPSGTETTSSGWIATAVGISGSSFTQVREGSAQSSRPITFAQLRSTAPRYSGAAQRHRGRSGMSG